MIDVVIPFKDREQNRVQKVVNLIKNNGGDLISSITIVDYNSKKEIKLDNCKILKIRNKVGWNKAHALNLGILSGNSPYIMTVDADILISKEHFNKIKENLSKNRLIIDTNVRRLLPEDYSEDYHKMVVKSHPWRKNDRNQYFNQANGGFQVYSRKFYDSMGGIMESLGFYSGAMDNYTYFMARINGLDICDISLHLLHLEHDKQKNDNFNLSEEEDRMAKFYGIYKALYLDNMVLKKIKKNEESCYGEELPCDDLFKQFKYEYENKDKLLEEAIKSNKKEITICGQRFMIEGASPRILISVINNTGMMPDYFVWELFKLYNHTKKFFPDVDIQQVNACNIDTMRNLSVKYAIGENPEGKHYDYLVMLDDDHLYAEDLIVEFIKIMKEKNIPILAPLTPGKRKPYYNTQYKKFLNPINQEGNNLESDKQGLVKVEASGPVAMVLDTKIFKDLEFPYYITEYSKFQGKDSILGSDLYFCKKLLEKKIPLWINTEYSCAHFKSLPLNRGKVMEI